MGQLKFLHHVPEDGKERGREVNGRTDAGHVDVWRYFHCDFVAARRNLVRKSSTNADARDEEEFCECGDCNGKPCVNPFSHQQFTTLMHCIWSVSRIVLVSCMKYLVSILLLLFVVGDAASSRYFLVIVFQTVVMRCLSVLGVHSFYSLSARSKFHVIPVEFG